MCDIAQGDYILHYYTKKGTKIKDLTEVHKGSRMDAKEIGEETIESQGPDPVVHSYTIDMRMFNSLDGDKFE